MTEGRPGGAQSSADCCRPSLEVDPRIARHFNRRVRKRMTQGDAFELAPISRTLFELLGPTAEARVLEIGSGPGSMAMALLEGGVHRYTGIDLAPATVEFARQRATEAGYADRATFSQGDAASARLEPHDWVVLDRAVCCYPDPDRLIANSAAAARRRLGFSVPDSRGLRGFLNRILIGFGNLTLTVRRDACRGFVHDLRRIDRRLADAGLRRLRDRNAGLWYAAVYERSPDSGPSVLPGAGGLVSG